MISLYLVYYSQKVSIIAGNNELVPMRYKAITWTGDDQDVEKWSVRGILFTNAHTR